jgi:hypothetical protein
MCDKMPAIHAGRAERSNSRLLDVHFVNTLSVRGVPGRLGHSREGENPGGEGQGCWMPAFAGMTFSSPCTGA